MVGFFITRLKRDEHGEQKGEFGDGGDFGLNEHGGFLRIDADGEPVGGDVDDGLADVLRVFRRARGW